MRLSKKPTFLKIGGKSIGVSKNAPKQFFEAVNNILDLVCFLGHNFLHFFLATTSLFFKG